jgi:hypothetical protein
VRELVVGVVGGDLYVIIVIIERDGRHFGVERDSVRIAAEDVFFQVLYNLLNTATAKNPTN